MRQSRPHFILRESSAFPYVLKTAFDAAEQINQLHSVVVRRIIGKAGYCLEKLLFDSALIFSVTHFSAILTQLLQPHFEAGEARLGSRESLSYIRDYGGGRPRGKAFVAQLGPQTLDLCPRLVALLFEIGALSAGVEEAGEGQDDLGAVEHSSRYGLRWDSVRGGSEMEGPHPREGFDRCGVMGKITIRHDISRDPAAGIDPALASQVSDGANDVHDQSEL
jgi:hypothetical protein